MLFCILEHIIYLKTFSHVYEQVILFFMTFAFAILFLKSNIFEKYISKSKEALLRCFFNIIFSRNILNFQKITKHKTVKGRQLI